MATAQIKPAIATWEASSAVTEPRRHLWTQEEFQGMIDAGLFEDRNIELVDGEILEMPPQDEPHYKVIMRLWKALSRVFGEGFSLRPQGPFIVSDNSRIAPDMAVVKGDDRSLASPPREAVLIVEASYSTLAYDRGDKAGLYARAGVEDYWLIDLASRRLEIRRKPIQDATQRFGWRYDEVQIVEAAEKIAPLAAPDRPIRVDDLLH